MSGRIILVGCVAQKEPFECAARDLYLSPLFRKRRAYAEASGHPWAILSAFHGLVMPDEEIRPYNVKLTDFRLREREAWGDRVAHDLRRKFDLDGAIVEVHAGAAYVDAVRSGIHWLWGAGNARAKVEAPLARLGIGEQLAWYGARAAA